MFVRFRETVRMLQASLVETRRSDGKVRHGHIGSLGSIKLAMSIADRTAFWAVADERLARLANRIGPDMDKIIAALRERVPVVTADELQAAKDRTERIARGEFVLDGTMTEDEIAIALGAYGMTVRDMREVSRENDLRQTAGRIGLLQQVDDEIKGAVKIAMKRARRLTTRLLLRGVKSLERDAIAAGIASAAEAGIEVTPEEMFEILEQARVEAEERAE
jgi:hypothetical protein